MQRITQYFFSKQSFVCFCRSLVGALDKTKKRYQSRIKHMEQQVLQSLIKGATEDTARPLLTFPSDLDSSEKSDSELNY